MIPNTILKRVTGTFASVRFVDKNHNKDWQPKVVMSAFGKNRSSPPFCYLLCNVCPKF